MTSARSRGEGPVVPRPLGFALAGIGIVFRREQSFRIQCVLGLGAAAVTAALRPGWVWAALVALSIGLVFAAELPMARSNI